MDSVLKKIVGDAVARSIWKPVSVTEEPHTKVTSWQVMLVPANGEYKESRHIVGWTGYEGRVSSAIKDWDPNTKIATTNSGRKYELVGHPGLNRDAMYVWSNWISHYGENIVPENVSNDYL